MYRETGIFIECLNLPLSTVLLFGLISIREAHTEAHIESETNVSGEASGSLVPDPFVPPGQLL